LHGSLIRSYFQLRPGTIPPIWHDPTVFEK
jgi:hypothetical protein